MTTKLVYSSGSISVSEKDSALPSSPNASKGKFELKTSFGYSGTFETLESAIQEGEKIERSDIA